MNKYSQEKIYTTADMKYVDSVVADIMKPVEDEAGHWARKLFLLGLLLSVYSEDDTDVAPLDKVPSMDIETGFLTGKTPLPASLQAVPQVGSVLPLTLDQQRALKLAEHEIATYITGISDKIRQEIREAIINAQMQKVHPQQLAHDLYNRFKGIQKNWRLIAITENATIASIGFMSRMKDGEELESHSMSDACPECKKLLNGRKFKFSSTPPLSATDPLWDTHLWIGKNNVGRKRADWKPCIPLHPACRCWWTVAYIRKSIMDTLTKAGTIAPPVPPSVGKKATGARVPALNQSAGKLQSPSAQMSLSGIKQTPESKQSVPTKTSVAGASPSLQGLAGQPRLEPSKLKGTMRPGHRYVWREGESGNYIYHYSDEQNNAYTSPNQLHHDHVKPLYETNAPAYKDSQRKQYDEGDLGAEQAHYRTKYQGDEYYKLVRIEKGVSGQLQYFYYNPLVKQTQQTDDPLRSVLNDKPIMGTNFGMPHVKGMTDAEWEKIDRFHLSFEGEFAKWSGKHAEHVPDPAEVDRFMNADNKDVHETSLIFLKKEKDPIAGWLMFFANPLNGKIKVMKEADTFLTHNDPLMVMTGEQKWADIKKEGRVDLDDVLRKFHRFHDDLGSSEKQNIREMALLSPSEKQHLLDNKSKQKIKEEKQRAKGNANQQQANKFYKDAQPTDVVRFGGARDKVEKFLGVCAQGKHDFAEDMSSGVNMTVRVHIPKDGDAVVKHQLTEKEDQLRATIPVGEQWRREILAYDMDKILNLGIVPPTVRGKLNKKVAKVLVEKEIENGNIEEADAKMAVENLMKSDNASMQHFVSGDIEEGNAGEASHKAVMRLALFDYVCGNTDRHHGNFFLDRKTSHLIAIDNGLCFALANWYNADGIQEFHGRNIRKLEPDILKDLKTALTPEGKAKIYDAFKKSGVTGHRELADVTLHRMKYVVDKGTIPSSNKMDEIDAKSPAFKSYVGDNASMIADYGDLSHYKSLYEKTKQQGKKRDKIKDPNDYDMERLDVEAIHRRAREFEIDEAFAKHDPNRLLRDELPVLLDEEQTKLYNEVDHANMMSEGENAVKDLADHLDYMQAYKVLRMGFGKDQDVGNNPANVGAIEDARKAELLGNLAYGRYHAMRNIYERKIIPFLNVEQWEKVNGFIEAEDYHDKIAIGKDLVENLHAEDLTKIMQLASPHVAKEIKEYQMDKHRPSEVINNFWDGVGVKHGAEFAKKMRDEGKGGVVNDPLKFQAWLAKFDDADLKQIANRGMIGKSESPNKAIYAEMKKRNLGDAPARFRGQPSIPDTASSEQGYSESNI